jgi:type I restriction enzyme S subunit
MKAGWKTVKLGEIAEIYNGNTVSDEDKKRLIASPNAGLAFIATKDVGFDGVINYDNGINIPGDEAGDFKVARKDAVLVCAEGGSAGRKIGHIDRDVHFGNKLFAINASSAVHPRHLYYYCLSEDFRKKFKGMMAGLIGGVSVAKFKQIEIPLPPLVEQKRIVALLDEAFAGIDTLSSNAKTRSSEALYVFEQERDSFFANPDNKYTETTISDITTRLQYGTSEKSASTGRYVVLRMGNIQDGEIDYEDLKYTSSQEVIDQYSLKPGDVLFNRTNSPQWVGKSAIYRGEMPAVFAGYNIKIHTIADKVDSEFLTFFLNSDRAMSFGRATFISSVNQANINAEKLRSYRLPLPPLREQKAIAERLGQIRKMSRELAAIYQNSLAHSHHLKAATLGSAFSGTL